MDTVVLFKDIKEFSDNLTIDETILNDNHYREKQFKLMDKIETDMAIYKSDLRKYRF